MLKKFKKEKDRAITEKFKKENGQSMVEFALILPILLLIVCGIMDFGWILYNQLALSNSARDGARFAVVNTTPTNRIALINSEVLSVTPASLQTGLVITITYSNTTTPLLGDVTVLLTTNVKVLTPLLGIYYSNQQKSIHASVTMKVES
jgi:Flp pilus assembly protein TadG